MSLGPIMLDLDSVTMSPEEKEILKHPLVGGVILFTRNFSSVEQVTQLVKEIHELREPKLLVAVDHEGGRVQRFRDGFSSLPAVGHFGEIYKHNPKRAHLLSETAGWLMAAGFVQLVSTLVLRQSWMLIMVRARSLVIALFTKMVKLLQSSRMLIQ